jgi:hypothetical protein
MNPFLKPLVDLALAEVGVREEGCNNRGPRICEYQAATWLKPAPWPWCAAFICWLIREWLKLPAVREALSPRNDKRRLCYACVFGEDMIPKHSIADCHHFGLYSWGKKVSQAAARPPKSSGGALKVWAPLLYRGHRPGPRRFIGGGFSLLVPPPPGMVRYFVILRFSSFTDPARKAGWGVRWRRCRFAQRCGGT